MAARSASPSPDVPLSVVEPDDMQAAARRIERELGPRIKGEVRASTHDRMLYATDASIYQVPPVAVVIPRDLDDVRIAVEHCAERGLPLLSRGAGTSLAGQTVNGAVVLDFSRHLRRLLELDPQTRTARLEPGLVLERLNEAAGVHGLMFGPDVATSAQATLGGMIGNNSAGAHSVLYGRTVEHLLSLEVLLADGRALTLEPDAARRDPRVEHLTREVAAIVQPLEAEIDRRFPRIVRHVDGYNLDIMLRQLRDGGLDAVNLAHLVCGSEGTLAVVVGATVGLVEAPAAKGLAIIAFDGVDAALEAVAGLLQDGPAAIELIDDAVIELARSNRECCRHLELLPPLPEGGAVLYVEHFAVDDADLRRRLDAVVARHGERDVRRWTDAGSMERAWRLRKSGEPLLYGAPGARKPLTFIEDTAVDPSVLPQFIRRFREIVARHGTRAAYYAHASVGCLHIRPMIDPRDASDLAAMQAIAEEATDLVLEYGGALSGEHGDGRLRTELLERYYGPSICEAFRRIRRLFDPGHRLNPGNITGDVRLAEKLRVSPRGRPIAVADLETYFTYEREHGFGPAIEMCNGAGVCRRMAGGAMCPSYRATQDERHAPRGRGNALRLAITGQFSPDGSTAAWNDAETLATLEWCLSCKACKTECPSNVDIAKLRSEYLAQGYRAARRVPLQARAFAGVRTLNRIGSAMPSLTNALVRFDSVRVAAQRLLGIDRRRSMPRFMRSLHRRNGARPATHAGADAPVVILYPDCFTVYNEPDIGSAAVELLETLGYTVILPRLGCCGRAAISCGMLEHATRAGRSAARRLLALCAANRAVAVVGCEPSCVSAIRDEWCDLRLGVPAAAIASLADRTHLVEDFLETRWDDHPVRPETRGDAGEGAVLLHGHCHQKALWGVERTADLLRRIAGPRLEVLDSGCCGMAGSFGYGHYDLSMRIAAQSVFPLIESRPGATVIAPGTSCRHQLRDGIGVEAEHPVQYVARRLVPGTPQSLRPSVPSSLGPLVP